MDCTTARVEAAGGGNCGSGGVQRQHRPQTQNNALVTLPTPAQEYVRRRLRQLAPALAEELAAAAAAAEGPSGNGGRRAARDADADADADAARLDGAVARALARHAKAAGPAAAAAAPPAAAAAAASAARGAAPALLPPPPPPPPRALRFAHACRYSGCRLDGCALCRHNPNRRCQGPDIFEEAYADRQALKSRCGADVCVALGGGGVSSGGGGDDGGEGNGSGGGGAGGQEEKQGEEELWARVSLVHAGCWQDGAPAPGARALAAAELLKAADVSARGGALMLLTAGCCCVGAAWRGA